jgi:nicotinamide riboside transporter PnuC
MKGREVALIALSTVAVTVAFYFILAALDTSELLVSTVSVATSFFASMLVFFRSPYYGAAYALNDIVLIVLWLLAAFRDISSLPMVFCFLMFLLNDIYGTVNWLRMQKEQEKNQKT